jgi:hypothetical protein
MYSEGDLVIPAHKISSRRERLGDREYDILRSSHYGSDTINDVSYGIYVGTTRVKKSLTSKVLILKHVFMFGDKMYLADPELMKLADQDNKPQDK